MPTVSTTYAASTQPTSAARSRPSPHVERGQEAGPERVADTGRLERRDVLGRRQLDDVDAGRCW